VRMDNKVLDKGVNFVMAEKSSARIVDKSTKVMGKAQVRKDKAFHDLGNNKPTYPIFNSLDPLHLAKVAKTCGVVLGDKVANVLEVINTLETQERAHAVLTEARVRKEIELQREKEKNKKVISKQGRMWKKERCAEERGTDHSVEGARVHVLGRRQMLWQGYLERLCAREGMLMPRQQQI
jgi:hypothetical protein